MNFNAFFLRSFRVLLLPFALLYGLIVFIRNVLYDKGWMRSSNFNFPIICIGNLSVGGTGKSPMTEYLLRLLQDKFQMATVSRGYKRKTKGYVLANEQTTALEIGDEPMQFHLKFPAVTVAVGEERLVAIPQLLHDRPTLQAIILDDAFQHREVRAGLNILLTQFGDLYIKDFFLPTGDLRDEKRSAKRADIIVVTKCPENMTQADAEKIRKEIHPKTSQQLFFTTIQYETPYHISSAERRSITTNDEVLLVCGIANPKPIKEYLFNHSGTYYQLDYSDHHIFGIDDLNDIRKKFSEINGSNKMIITTEKDAVRLLKFNNELQDLPLFVLPVQHRFLFNDGDKFDALVIDFIRHFKMEE